MTTAVSKVYAKAAFEFAQESGKIERWQHFLDRSAEVFSHEEIKKIIKMGQVTQRKLVDDFSGDVHAQEQEMQNFLWLLADKKRLLCLPEITTAFRQYLAEANQQLIATVLTVLPLTQEQQDKLQNSLSEKTGSAVQLNCQEDSAILGGLVIKMGDKVIDRSLAGTIMRLKQHMLG